MLKPGENTQVNLQYEEPKIIERFMIYLNRITANYFWKIVDNLAYSNSKIAEIYERAIGKEYQKELETFDISEKNKILHIGCGAYPLTELMLANLSVREIVGVDKNPKAVKLAKEVIHKKKLDKKIKIEHGNGLNYPVDRFDVIVVSSCSVPKLEILKHILKTAKKQTTIILRELEAPTNYILNYINQHDDIDLENKTHHYTLAFLIPMIWNSFQLKKK